MVTGRILHTPCPLKRRWRYCRLFCAIRNILLLSVWAKEGRQASCSSGFEFNYSVFSFPAPLTPLMSLQVSVPPSENGIITHCVSLLYTSSLDSAIIGWKKCCVKVVMFLEAPNSLCALPLPVLQFTQPTGFPWSHSTLCQALIPQNGNNTLKSSSLSVKVPNLVH